MTKKEAYRAVIDGNITAEVLDYFTIELQKMEEKDRARKSTLTQQQIENERIKEQILTFFLENPGPHFVDEIVPFVQISRQKCSVLCNQLIKSGKLSQKDETVKGKGKRKLYFLP